MKTLFKLIISAVKSKVGPLLAKLRKMAAPEYLKSVLLVKIRLFFLDIFDIRPQDETDYYTAGSWQVSRKLVLTAAVLLGAAGLFVIITFQPFHTGGSPGSVRTYRYDSLPLKFQKGNVEILARDGHTAYVGEVDKGWAAGEGKLYGKTGNLIYEGNFRNSMFHGTGKLYYDDGAVKYEGNFAANLYEGQGTGYWNNGSPEYRGNYEKGKKSGEGELFNAGGSPVFAGLFGQDEPVYAQLLGKTTKEAGEIYQGSAKMYQGNGEVCMDLMEIYALCDTKDGSDSLEGAWKVERVYVLKNEFPLAGTVYRNTEAVAETLGEPSYQGYSGITLAEAVGITKLKQRQNLSMADPELKTEAVFEEAAEVTGYNRGYDLYLYAFEHEGLVYGFYCENENGNFVMYSIEKESRR